MTETPKCPYCGAEMLDDSYTWICPKCRSNSPVVIWDEEKVKGMTEEEKMAYAREAALHRAEPEMRPLTLDEINEVYVVQPEPGWISVKDRLPEDDATYLVYGRNGYGIAFAIYYGDGEWLTCDDLTNITRFVTHWMPLPEPPKEE